MAQTLNKNRSQGEARIDPAQPVEAQAAADAREQPAHEAGYRDKLREAADHARVPEESTPVPVEDAAPEAAGAPGPRRRTGN